MRIGTKSVLYGAHAFWLHPVFVAVAWWRLYGFPWDPRLWVAFFVHDLGYWGKPNMDGPEGERHPEWGARCMARWFDGTRDPLIEVIQGHPDGRSNPREALREKLGTWGRFCLLHSRFYAKRACEQPSRLCFADKLAICITPWWVYRWTAGLTGEIREYRQKGANPSKGWSNAQGPDRQWYIEMQAYMRRWIAEHVDGREDTWTPSERVARDETGVWS